MRKQVRALRFSPAGNTLASGGSDGTLRLRVSELLFLVLLSGIATNDLSAAEQPETPPQQLTKTISVAYSSDGRTLASLDSDRTIRLWDVALGKERKKVGFSPGKDERPESITYTPDGGVIVLLYKYDGFKFDKTTGVATQGTISCCLWNMTSSKKSPFVKIGYGGKAICSKGRLFAYGNGLWDIATGKQIREFKVPPGLIYEIEFSPDGRTLAYWICESLAQDGSLIFLLDVATGKKVLQVGEFDWDNLRFSRVSPPKFSPDGKTIAFSDPEGSIRLRNVIHDKDIHRILREKNEVVLAFSPDGRTLVSWDRSSGTMRLWETATGKERRSIKIRGEIRALTFSADGRTMALMKGNTIEFRKMWE